MNEYSQFAAIPITVCFQVRSDKNCRGILATFGENPALVLLPSWLPNRGRQLQLECSGAPVAESEILLAIQVILLPLEKARYVQL